MYSFFEIEKEVEESYIGHHFFDWKKPREVWYHSNCDVFFDFGDEVLWKLMEFGENRVLCVRKINKDYFIKRAIENNNIKKLD